MPSLYAISKNLSSTFVDIFENPPLYLYKIRHIYTPKKKRPSGYRIYTATCKRIESYATPLSITIHARHAYTPIHATTASMTESPPPLLI